MRAGTYYYEVVDCASAGARAWTLSTNGWSFHPNPTGEHNARYREVTPALGVPIPITNRLDAPLWEPYDLTLKTKFFTQSGQSASTLRTDVQNFLLPGVQYLQGYTDEAAGWDERHPRWGYLRIEYWNGSGWSGYYVYADYLGASTVSVPMTGGHVMDVSLHFRVTDPIMYGGTVTDTINVTSCGPTTETIAAVGSRRGIRMCIYVRNNSNHDPSLVVITNDRGDSANFNGQLTVADEYWKLDCYEGRLYRGTSYVTEVDVTGTQFSGDFLSSDVSTDTFTASCDDATSGNGASTNFQVHVYSRYPKY